MNFQNFRHWKTQFVHVDALQGKGPGSDILMQFIVDSKCGKSSGEGVR